ncbi:MAG: hypothetical protein K2X99_09355 [Gemmatimonadaceae bacterium]|nr:hypothetical protein [Gemmatimonadaceae bacterium]
MRQIATTLLLSTLVAAGCSPPSTLDSSGVSTVRVVGTGGGGTAVNAQAVTFANDALIKASALALWKALPAAYDSVGITFGILDAARLSGGHSDLRPRRRLGKAALSTLLDCGSAQGAPSADSYDVRLSVLSQLTRVTDSTTTLSTLVQATARPISTAGDPVRCTTTGVLEGRIKAVAQQLATGR